MSNKALPDYPVSRMQETGVARSVFDTLNSPRHNHQIDASAGLLVNQSATLLREIFRSQR
ncbi:adenosine deaminase [Dokdonella sp.]|uniref:adenosine deaminase n=1 Tax=Dokdonella sp. TaxID=2291710 RepID=UPI003C3DF8F0